MVDIRDNTFTNSFLLPGSPIVSDLQSSNNIEAFRANLLAGYEYRITIRAHPVEEGRYLILPLQYTVRLLHSLGSMMIQGVA